MKYQQSVRAIFLCLALVGMSACSSFRPRSPEWELPALSRGWSYIESSEQLADVETGSPPLNFTSGIISGNRLVYTSHRFGIMVFNKENGNILWQKTVPNTAPTSTAFVRDKKVFAGFDDGFFRAFNLDTGELLWTADLRFPPIGTPAMNDGRILVGSEDHAVHALDAATGKSLWVYRRGSTGAMTIKGGANATYFRGKFWVGFSDGTLVALNPDDGAVSVEKQYLDNPKFFDLDAPPVAWKQSLLVTTYDGRLRSLAHDGSINWTFPAGGSHAPVPSSAGGGLIFLSASDGYVYAVGDQSAKEFWKFPVRRGIPTGIGLFGPKGESALAVASSDNYIYLLDPVSGKKLGEQGLGSSSGSYSSLVADPDRPDRFFLVSHMGRIHEFTVRSRK